MKQAWFHFCMWWAFRVWRVLGMHVAVHLGYGRLYMTCRHLANWSEDIGRLECPGWEIYD